MSAGAETGIGASHLLVERYLEHVRTQRKLASRTVDLYALELNRLQTRAVQSTGTALALEQVRNAHVRRWVAQLHAQGQSPRSLALTLSVWRGFYAWLGREGLIASNPVQDLRPPKVARLLPKALAVDEAVQLASYQKESVESNNNAGQLLVLLQKLTPARRREGGEAAWLELRDRAFTELLYSSGLRVGELVGLDVRADRTGEAHGHGWVDLDEATAHVRGKGAKWRSVPVGGPALAALRAWLAVREAWLVAQSAGRVGADGHQALFIGRNGTRLTPQSIWQRLRARAQQAGLGAPVHPHMLRHSFASHVLQSSGDLRAVQELLGHASISATQVYTRLDFQHLAKAYDAAHPRAVLCGAKEQSVQTPAAQSGDEEDPTARR